MSKPKRVVFVGTGGRANAYTWNSSREDIEVAGCADPNRVNRKNFLGLNSLVDLVPEFDDWRTMFESVRNIDGVVITTPNHQHVQIEYHNGVLAALLMDFSCGGKICGRYLKVTGTRGVIWGKLEDNRISLHDKQMDRVEEVDLKSDGSGHGGSDRAHTAALLRMMEDPTYVPSATLESGYLSARLCYAADESAEKGQQIDVSQLMTEAGLILRCEHRAETACAT